LTDWRRRYMKFFLTQFEASLSRTDAWLKRVVLPARDRILFLIELENGIFVGHIGASNISASSAELDNLIRGRKGGDARLIYYAELALLRWIFFSLEKEFALLHVFSTNEVTAALHKSVGFRLHAQNALSKTQNGGDVEYLVDSPKGERAEFVYNEMRLNKQTFITIHGKNDGFAHGERPS
jgi:hypothetical protein